MIKHTTARDEETFIKNHISELSRINIVNAELKNNNTILVLSFVDAKTCEVFDTWRKKASLTLATAVVAPVTQTINIVCDESLQNLLGIKNASSVSISPAPTERVNPSSSASLAVNNAAPSSKPLPVTSATAGETKPAPKEDKGYVHTFKTTKDGDCFFHAIYGKPNFLGEYEAENASLMRAKWHSYLNGFASLDDMPIALKEQMEKILIIFKDNPSKLTGKSAEIKLLSDQVNSDYKQSEEKLECLKKSIFKKYISDNVFQGRIYKIICDAYSAQGKSLPNRNDLQNENKFNSAINLNLAVCAAIYDPPILADEFKATYSQTARNTILQTFYNKAYPIYLSAISSSSYYIFTEEIPIIAAIANIEHINLHLEDGSTRSFTRNIGLLPAGFVPDTNIWGIKKTTVRVGHTKRPAHYSYATLMPTPSVSPAVSVLIPPDRKQLPEGLNTSTHGDKYQLDLLALVAHRARTKAKKFTLISDDGDFGKWDDLVVEYEDRITFLQAKHAKNPQEEYTANELCAVKDNDVSMAKYYDTWVEMQKKYKQKDLRFIFFTNRQLDADIHDAIDPVGLPDDEFLFAGLDSKTYQFKKDHPLNKRVLSAILQHSKSLPKQKVTVSLDDKVEKKVDALIKSLTTAMKSPNTTHIKTSNRLSLAILDLKPLAKETFEQGLKEETKDDDSSKLAFRLKDSFIDNIGLMGIAKIIRDKLKISDRQKNLLKQFHFICPKAFFEFDTSVKFKDDGKKDLDTKFLSDSKNTNNVTWHIDSECDQLVLLALFDTNKLPLNLSLDSLDSVIHQHMYEGLLARFDKHLAVNRARMIALERPKKDALKRAEEATSEQIKKKALADAKLDQKDKVFIATIQSLAEAAVGFDIESFFSQFYWKVAQPESPTIEDVIKKELRLNQNIGSDELYHKLYKYLFDWFADPNSTMLLSNQFYQYAQHSQEDLNRFYLLGRTQKFKRQCQDAALSTEMKAALISKPLKDFLDEKNPISYTAIVHGEAETGHNIAVYQAIEATNFVVSDDDWAFLTTRSLYLGQLARILQYGTTLRLAVIEIGQEFNTPEIIAHICNVAALRGKKIILIIYAENFEEINLIKELRKNWFDDSSSGRKFTPIQMQKLAQPNINNICESKKNNVIITAGKQRKIIDILNQPNYGLYNMMQYPGFLQDILNHSTPASEVKSNKLDLPYHIYEDNKIITYHACYNLAMLVVQVPAEIFVVHDAPYDFLNTIRASLNPKEGNPKVATCLQELNEETAFIIINEISDTKHWETLLAKKRKIIVYGRATASACLTNVPNLVKLKITRTTNKELRVLIANNFYSTHLPPAVDYLEPQEAAEAKIETATSRLDLLTETERPCIRLFSADAGKGKSALFKYEEYYWRQTESKGFYQWVFRLSLPKLVLEHIDLSAPFALERLLLASANELAPPIWKLKALKHDIEQGHIKLFLDAWDEVKGSKQQQIIAFINGLPPNLSYDITTRPYAKSLLTLARIPNHYHALNPFDDEEIKSYMKKFFVKAAGVNDEEFISIAKPIFTFWKGGLSQSTSKFIGIPLQAYLVCEWLLPSVKAWKLDSSKDFSAFFEEEGILTPAVLYQRFTFKKLRKFLKKHLKMTNNTLEQAHRVYELTHTYSNLAMVIAYQQALGKPINFIDQHQRGTFYTTESLRELPNTGIITRLPTALDGDKYTFIHATYEDYFAALFILKTMLTDKRSSAYQEIMTDIRDKRYYDRYQNIFAFAMQLAISGDLSIPGLEVYRREVILNFWLALTQLPQDILGQGQAKLISFCISELTETQKKALFEILPEELICSIIQKPKESQLKHSTDDEDSLSIRDNKDEAKKLIFQVASIKTTSAVITHDLDEKTITKELANKSTVFQSVMKMLNEDAERAKVIAPLLLSISPSSSYWDVDGGFSAMALLGNQFNMQHASYFIQHIDRDPSFRTQPAAKAILSLIKHPLEEQAFDAFVQVFFVLCTQASYTLKMNIFIKQVSQTIAPILLIKGLIKLIHNRLNGILCLNKLDDISQAADFSEIIRIMFFLVYEYNYAVTYEKEKGIMEVFGNDSLCAWSLTEKIKNLFNPFLEKIISLLAKKNNINPFLNKLPSSLLLTDEAELFAKVPAQDQLVFIKEMVTSDKECNPFFKWLRKNSLDSKFTGLLAQNLNQIIIKGVRKDNHWPRKYGIESIGYTNRYFNNKLAIFLSERATMWSNNKVLAIIALKTIYEDLTKIIACNDIDDNVVTAVTAYNSCITKLIFLNDGLENIEPNAISAFLEDKARCALETTPIKTAALTSMNADTKLSAWLIPKRKSDSQNTENPAAIKFKDANGNAMAVSLPPISEENSTETKFDMNNTYLEKTTVLNVDEQSINDRVITPLLGQVSLTSSHNILALTQLGTFSATSGTTTMGALATEDSDNKTESSLRSTSEQGTKRKNGTNSASTPKIDANKKARIVSSSSTSAQQLSGMITSTKKSKDNTASSSTLIANLEMNSISSPSLSTVSETQKVNKTPSKSGLQTK